MATLAQLHETLVTDSSLADRAALVEFDHVTHDSRAVAPGTLFVAVTGDNVDGHRFIRSAVEAGAVAVVGTHSYSQLCAQAAFGETAVPYLQVTDSRQALARTAALLYDFPSHALTVVGVTGTDGKTTTSTILEAILTAATTDESGSAGRVGVITTVGARIRGVEQDTGFHVTTPDAPQVQRFLAQMRDSGCRFAVVESTSHGLAQSRVAAVAFDVAAVTNITHEHLDYHGSREAYLAAKALLFRSLFASPAKPHIPRLAVLNADDPGSSGFLLAVLDREQSRSDVSVLTRTYGLDPRKRPDVAASDIVYGADRTCFTVRWWNGEFSLHSHLVGEYNVYNVLCAATIALSLGVMPKAIQRGVFALRGVVGRMERIDCGQPFLALIDFAHSPASLERALTVLRTVVNQNDAGGRIIAIFGSAGLRDREKRHLMGKVSGRLADFTVVTAEDPRTESLDEINRAIAAGALEHAAVDKVAIVPDRSEAIQYAVDMARPGDVVAAFGKGHERSMCFGEDEYPWSDQSAMAQALQRRLSYG